MVLDIVIPAGLVAVFAYDGWVTRPAGDHLRLIGDVAGVLAGLLFLAETVLAPESIALTVAAAVCVLALAATHIIGLRGTLRDSELRR